MLASEADVRRGPGPSLRFTGTCTEEEFTARCGQQDFWYHSYYFDNGFAMRGDYDIAENIAEYGFPDDMTGLSVLDVGTGGGWFSFYLEQRGAAVTTTDVRGYVDFDVFGRYDYPPIDAEKLKPDRVGDDGQPIYYSPVSGAFWLIHDLLGSRIEYVNSRVYDLSPELFGGRTFDLVFLGAVLPHLRDPVGALMRARSVCHDRLIATTVLAGDLEGRPAMDLPYVGFDPVSWWRPNLDCFEQWFRAAGFSGVDASTSVTLTCDKPMPSEHAPGVLRNPTHVLQRGEATV